MKARLLIALLCAAAISGLVVWWISPDGPRPSVETPSGRPAEGGRSHVTRGRTDAKPSGTTKGEKGDSARQAVARDDSEGEEAEEPPTEEERLAAAEEAKVDAFDALTDGWMEPSAKGVSTNDVHAFVVAFRNVPADRHEECVQRALNLIPDENVMLLVGLLLDGSLNEEVRELIFNDILNRDEDVKMPILRLIREDRSHPCWKDADWILDSSD